MDTDAFLNCLQRQPDYHDQIVHVEHIPAREPVFGALEKPLPEALSDALAKMGVRALYRHQAAAVNAVRSGQNVMVATTSASGKTMCYNLPVLEAVLSERDSRALYLFPTKALAQDQLRNLRELACPELCRERDFATFDGDTPQDERTAIRNQARVILTNPDMLHLGIMPNHESWSRLLRHLRYVVIDEAHTYRGVFGSHVANVMRRLRRLAAFYGARPQFICASATLANPGEHAERLVGLPFLTVSDDGSPQGEKEFVLWDPPLIDQAKSLRRSANSEAAAVFAELIVRGIRSLTFVRTRRLAELIYLYAKARLDETHPGTSQRITPYRAGYLPQDRRRIEQGLFGGELLGAVATNALELGIDIGDLEATVLTGYPGSIASTWQQAGRSGRGRERSLSVLIAHADPLDQYFMRHPDYLFQKHFEHALVNPANPYVLRAHLLCAAWELPLTPSDEAIFGASLKTEIRGLVEEGLLRERHGRWHLSPNVDYPAQKVGIRSTSSENFAVVDSSTGALMETVEASVAFFQIHPGAIYLHQGESFLITSLDLASRTARAKSTDATYYTQTKELTDLHILRVLREKQLGAVKVSLGKVQVTTAVVGFKKKAQFTEEVIGEEPLDLPPYRFPTIAVWFDLPPGAEDKLADEKLDFAGGLHAAEHAAIGILPLFCLCDRNDIGGVSTPLHPDTGQAQVFIYDAHPGGVGIAERGFDLIRELCETTLKTIRECPCQEGCPSCIQSPKCGNNNEPLDKRAAEILLAEILSQAGQGRLATEE